MGHSTPLFALPGNPIELTTVLTPAEVAIFGQVPEALAGWELWFQRLLANNQPVTRETRLSLIHEASTYLSAGQCEHQSIVVRKVLSNGAVQYVKQCTRCWNTTSTALAYASLSEEERSCCPDALSSEKRRQVTQALWLYMSTHINNLAEAAPTAQDIRWENLNAYYRTASWALAKKKAYAAHGTVCTSCYDRPATQIHHLAYKPGLYDLDSFELQDPVFNLRPVCKQCHQMLHPGRDL
jgi:hypothetical protein